MKKILIIGLVWPEPASSAAGWRMLQLIDFFIDYGYEVHFASSANPSPYSFPLSEKNVQTHSISLNNISFDEFINKLNPEIVLFDRFMTEEQFGWRVREQVPAAMTILDTEDLHFVRRAREKAYKRKEKVDLFTEDAKRELASLYRCDLSLVISLYEIEILQTQFGFSQDQLLYLPFMQTPVKPSENPLPSFEERKHLMFIGNFIHEPNYQSVLCLKKEIWPVLKQRLPDAELHIYGAYPTQKILQLHKPDERFRINGRAGDVNEIMKKYRLLIAPIPYGAGIKGKFVDAMRNGLPSITTFAGSEAMSPDEWCGFVSDDVAGFVSKATLLYQQEHLWYQKQNKGFRLYNTSYDKTFFQEKLQTKIKNIFIYLQQHRQKHFIGQILQFQQWNAYKYMSLWIEEKNSKS